jgi:hypothetical protein
MRFPLLVSVCPVRTIALPQGLNPRILLNFRASDPRERHDTAARIDHHFDHGDFSEIPDVWDTHFDSGGHDS